MILSPWQSPSFDKFGKNHFLFYHKYKLMTIRDKIIIVKVTELNYNKVKCFDKSYGGSICSIFKRAVKSSEALSF